MKFQLHFGFEGYFLALTFSGVLCQRVERKVGEDQLLLDQPSSSEVGWSIFRCVWIVGAENQTLVRWGVDDDAVQKCVQFHCFDSNNRKVHMPRTGCNTLKNEKQTEWKRLMLIECAFCEEMGCHLGKPCKGKKLHFNWIVMHNCFRFSSRNISIR